MATATVTAATSVQFHQVPIDQLATWSKNPRKHWNKEDDAELANNIRVNGVIEPLIARPTLRPEIFEIIAGERRLRAAKSAGFTRLPVVVRDLDDGQALEFALAENGHRNNLHPLDEAAAFSELQRINPGVNTIEHLAAQHGRSLRYLKDSLALLALEPKVKKAFEDGEITVSHAKKIARLERARHPSAFEACFANEFDYDSGKSRQVLAPVSHLDDWIRDQVRLDLKSTEAQEDFPELVADVTSAQAAGATVLMLSDGYGTYGQKAKDGDPLTRHQWEECKAKDAGAVLGVIVEGRRRGKKLYVKLTTKPKHSPSASAASASPKKKTAAKRDRDKKERTAEATRRQEEEARRARGDLVATRAIIEAASKVKAFAPDALRAIGSVIGGASALSKEQDEAISKALGIPATIWASWDNTAALKKLSSRQVLRAIVVLVLSHEGVLQGEFATTCQAFGVDVKKIDAAIAAAHKAAAAAAKPTVTAKPAKKAKARK